MKSHRIALQPHIIALESLSVAYYLTEIQSHSHSSYQAIAYNSLTYNVICERFKMLLLKGTNLIAD